MRKPHSFDIFDTLMARRCIEPKNVFLEVEKAVNVAGFANLRIKAEASIAAKPYTLDDIYRVFVEQFGVNVETSEYLKAKEIELELHNAIAIKENLEAVDNGDVLVTDMYLPRSAILGILDKIVCASR